VAAWNYRSIQFPNGAKQLHEVHYDDQGTVTQWTSNPATFGAGDEEETVEDIALSLAHAIADTLRLPVLMATDLPGYAE
jgi:hypothetical protein